MPTIFIAYGFRFFFYSNENNEPPHVHIKKGWSEGKVWLEPKVEIVYMHGFRLKEQRQILQIVWANILTLKEKWYEHFGKQL